MHRSKQIEAAALVVSALGSGAAIVLYALGETKAAAAIGVTGLIVGTTLGAARILADDTDEDEVASRVAAQLTRG